MGIILTLVPGPAQIVPEAKKLPATAGATARRLPELVQHTLSKDANATGSGPALMPW
ncbi:hypothetical protein [Microvirga tunisiensis]|uniref:hypothetical protein n=1 Tax=Microvirga tunisiensis TaxID=2108360 RepID=UPI00129C983C|nr:hypothetical protein [Microvirga tunisiensis]